MSFVGKNTLKITGSRTRRSKITNGRQTCREQKVRRENENDNITKEEVTETIIDLKNSIASMIISQLKS